MTRPGIIHAMTVQDHYDAHLGPVYSWMTGDFAAVVEANAAELRELGLATPPPDALAIDLGAGPGGHALALARAGYEVIAIDNCEPLLAELQANTAGTAVRAVAASLIQFRSHAPQLAHVVACMGDTLTHLDSLATVGQLLADASAALAPGGAFVTTFRDYVGRELEGTSRFIPVRADADRILTCFLEYQPTIVVVHDLLYERRAAGWELRVSSYPKLRLDPCWVASRLETEGLAVAVDTGRAGMVRIVARRPA